MSALHPHPCAHPAEVWTAWPDLGKVLLSLVSQNSSFHERISVNRVSTYSTTPPYSWSVNSHIPRFPFSLDSFLLVYVCDCFACLYACVLCSFLMSVEVRRRYRIPWKWVSRQLWATMLVKISEPGSSARAPSALNHWVISLVPTRFRYSDSDLSYRTLNAWHTCRRS